MIKDINNLSPRFLRILLKCKQRTLKSCMFFKHAACITRGGKIYNYAVNDYNTGHSKIIKYSYHAEETLIKKIKETKGKKYDMFIVRTGPNGNLLNSKPCRHCINIMKKENNIRTIYYSISDTKIGIEKLNKIKSDHVSFGNKKNIIKY